ncbi:MAG: 5'/3'-nucleotidase SurE [Deltaproteobacteria bacterium]|nr:5'/3'-nucleotidase SurE [Deltaproteobacteria bacterium]MBW1922435.1 5'/3'-nucleotidase SurE [Deltaproteobacteria bacterium]MBW1949358.1 5'/3'-nucleotidase SurE [Deltaproteobacteria bacterium]MBW2007278.1 5'/3'-nucleotidase SurE [Deltaproteobacteria bacterium]MBW2101307.1 5'/3'-nucleotidase SurE [Deltaproteobacteria bacterium]
MTPRVLLTNDDGIYAPGLEALHEALASKYDVRIVAPETEMSAVGHAITLASPLRVREVRKEGRLFGYALSGTPADCVKIALQELFKKDPPHVILSGINLGANVGVNVLYSGTVSAATEGAFLGVPSAAVSLDTRKDPDFRFAAHFCSELVRVLREHPPRAGTAWNVNIPAVGPSLIRGIRFTRQGTHRFVERFERRIDPRGNVYYWLAGEKPVENGDQDADAAVLRANMISITPIQYDLTCEEEVARLRAAPQEIRLPYLDSE